MKSWEEDFNSAHRKGLRRLTAGEFLAVAAWWEFLREGGDDPHFSSTSTLEKEE